MKYNPRRRSGLVLRLKKHSQHVPKYTLLNREQGVCSREGLTARRERALSDAQLITNTQDDSNLQLREANEHLVIAAVESYIMADKLEKVRAEMSHLANHDFLTDLPNRMQLFDRISVAIALAKRTTSKLMILFLDLDRFKDVNDSCGHVIGDQLLQAVAQRLTSSVRESDTVSRPGGDEFVLLLPNADRQDSITSLIEKIHSTVIAPYSIAGNDIDIGATIGISMFPEDGEDAGILIRCADTAMYYAKERGGNTYQFFTSEMRGRTAKRRDMVASLQQALTLKQFVLFYQVQVNLESGSVTGVEALIRWRHPERGLLLPDAFIGDAEDCGVIVEIGRWVLLEACHQAKAWLAAGFTFNIIAVNVSAHQFADSHFFEDIQSVLHTTGLAPHRLELELTETVLLKNIVSTKTTLQTLRLLGVKIAIDDFGTGYSSLSYLKQFPIDTMKIDRSFVQDISNSGDDILVNAIIGIGKSFRHQIVAEGVETAEQFRILREHHCLSAQGFYLNRPMIAEEFTEFLKTRVGSHLTRPHGATVDPSE